MSDQKNDKILEVKNLKVSYHTYAGEVKSVRGVSFDLKEGEAIAIVGESGCGKSVTAKSIMGLIKGPQGEIKQGSEILYHGDGSERIVKHGGSKADGGKKRRSGFRASNSFVLRFFRTAAVPICIRALETAFRAASPRLKKGRKGDAP